MIVFGNVGGLLNLIVFVFLLTFLASIFASQLFRGEIPEEADGEAIRVPFNDIWNSFIGMYIIFSSENWTDILYNVTNYQKPFGIAWIGASFCILWFKKTSMCQKTRSVYNKSKPSSSRRSKA